MENSSYLLFDQLHFILRFWIFEQYILALVLLQNFVDQKHGYDHQKGRYAGA